MTLPEDYKNRMKAVLADGYDDYISCLNAPYVRSLRLSPRRVQSSDMERMSRIATCCNSPEPVSYCPGAYYYDSDLPGKLPLHEAGAYYIQEASAMLPVTMLDVDESGMKVLDLCAAPGGKSTQIADLMNGHGLLVSNEIISSRAAILSENVERMGVVNALVTSVDPNVLADRFPYYFDRILVDAPCSGEGMFRKHPEAAGQWSVENVKMCADRQDMILDCAAVMLAPGGRIVYSTCTFSPEEDEGSLERFIARHPEFEAVEGPDHIYPHLHRGEGHFAVALARRTESAIRPAGSDEIPESRSARAKKAVLDHVEDALLSDFLEGAYRDVSPVRTLIENNKDRLLKFGDGLYLAPEYMPPIKGLIVKRAGLRIGTFMKNRFTPDHALSHASSPEDVRFFVDYAHDSSEIGSYLSGMTIPCDPALKGWCLVCCEGIAAGWGKAAGGTIKNHYPKGLRKAFA